MAAGSRPKRRWALADVALLPVAATYGAMSQRLLKRRAANAYRSPLPVVSVGNLSIGGTGKTPLVIHLIHVLQPDRPVIVLTRGYGRSSRAPVVWLPGESAPDPSSFGDEPSLIARELRTGAIGVSVDRTELLRRLEPEFPDAVVVLDDGFQHRQLARDLDIVIVDERTARHGQPLPLGVLREPARGLLRADVIVITSEAAGEWAGARSRPDALTISMRTLPTAVRRWADGSRVDLECAVLVTGIAAPERVEHSASAFGIPLLATRRFRDHHRYTTDDALGVLELSRRHHAPVLTTTKDAVKLERFPMLAEALHVIETRVEFTPGDTLSRLLADRLHLDSQRA